MNFSWPLWLSLVAQAVVSPQPLQNLPPTPASEVDLNVYDLGNDIVAPRLISAQLPTVNGVDCKDHQHGKVMLDLVVDANGKPEQVYLVSALGNDLDRLALLTVEFDHFQPATRNGLDVAVRESAEVSIETCIEMKTDEAGRQHQMLRLRSQPLQAFSKFRAVPRQKAIKDVEWPYPLATPEALFSDEAKNRRISGDCIVKLIIDDHGMPQNMKVVRPLGHGLDEEALKAILKYRFRPALKNGKPVATPMAIVVTFRQ